MQLVDTGFRLAVPRPRDGVLPLEREERRLALGYKFDEKNQCWIAYYSKRNPKTGQPVSLRRTSIKTESEARKVEERKLIAIVQSKIEKGLPILGRNGCRLLGRLCRARFDKEICLQCQEVS